MKKWFCIFFVYPLIIGIVAACGTETGVISEADTNANSDADTDIDSDTDSDADTDTDVDTDTDSDSDTDSDTDVDSDSDGDEDTGTDFIDQDGDGWIEGIDCDDTNPDVNQGEEEIYDPPNGVDDDCDGLTDEEPTEVDTDTAPTDIIPDCSGCPSVGSTLDNLRCAADLCDDSVYLSGTYESTSGSPTTGTYQAVTRFGDTGNDLDPLLYGSYALVATGTATGTDHNVQLGGNSVADPYSNEDVTYDVMEWSVNLKAPDEAHGFKIHYVFFSEEYDEYISSQYNDKFYVVIEADSTNDGEPTVINFTSCREPDEYYDFICDSATMPFCDDGEKYCYIAINSAFSECCWYEGCPDGTWSTDISGTGYSCASDVNEDQNNYGIYGSSSGWLYTEWVINPGEEFTLTFHIHDTGDMQLDSEVILDKIVFVTEATPGTGVV